MRDAVLMGARFEEIAALQRLSEDPDYALPLHLARSLRAKGWVDTVGDSHLMTIAGRTLLEST